MSDPFDLYLDDKGYLVAWELGKDAYDKVGQDTIVEERDADVAELSENKLDGLKWSSQRSWFTGGKQSRRDAPNSDDEAYLVAKNVDISERGALRLSRQFNAHTSAPIATSTQAEAFAATIPSAVMWTAPAAADATKIQIRSVGDWGDTTPDARDAFPAGYAIQGLATDGQHIYAANHDGASPGIYRGTAGVSTTALTSWSTNKIRDIAFVKDRLMGWRTNGGNLEIREVSTETTPTEATRHTYRTGWEIRRITTGQDVFAEIGSHIAWIANNGVDGYLYLWDGNPANSPFSAARFPNIEALGCVSYANDRLYVLGRSNVSVNTDPNSYDSPDKVYDSSHLYDEEVTGSTDGKVVFIECDVSADGDVAWDVVFSLRGTPYPRFVVREREILFPIRLPGEEWRGLTSDAGVASDTRAYCIASYVVPSRGINVARYWGRTASSAIAGVLWGDDGFTAPALGVLRGSIGVIGEDGGTRRENDGRYAPDGELVSSRIDLNIDSSKVFFMGEASFDNLLNGESVVLQVTFDSPLVSTPSYLTIDTKTTGENIRALILDNGTPAPKEVAAYYRVRMLSNSDGSMAPVLRKAGLGIEPTVKPRYDHIIFLKAYDSMQLNNDSPWPGDRPPDTIQTELEDLRDNQSVIGFREPVGGREPRDETYVQVRRVNTKKIRVADEGWANLIAIQLREAPS